MNCAYVYVFFMWIDVCVSICVCVEELEHKKKNPTMQMEKTCSFMKKMDLFSFGCIAYIVVSLIFIIKLFFFFKCVANSNWNIGRNNIFRLQEKKLA